MNDVVSSCSGPIPRKKKRVAQQEMKKRKEKGKRKEASYDLV